MMIIKSITSFILFSVEHCCLDNCSGHHDNDYPCIYVIGSLDTDPHGHNHRGHRWGTVTLIIECVNRKCHISRKFLSQGLYGQWKVGKFVSLFPGLKSQRKLIFPEVSWNHFVSYICPVKGKMINFTQVSSLIFFNSRRHQVLQQSQLTATWIYQKGHGKSWNHFDKRSWKVREYRWGK